MVLITDDYDYNATDHYKSGAMAVLFVIDEAATPGMGEGNGYVDVWHWELDVGPGVARAFEDYVKKSGKEIITELHSIKDMQTFNEQIQMWSKKAVDFYEEICKTRASRTAWGYLTSIRSFFSTFGTPYSLNVKVYMERVKTKPHTEKFKHNFSLDELKVMCSARYLSFPYLKRIFKKGGEFDRKISPN